MDILIEQESIDGEEFRQIVGAETMVSEKPQETIDGEEFRQIVAEYTVVPEKPQLAPML